MSHGTNPPLSSPKYQDNMVGIANSVKGVLIDFLIPILPKIIIDPTRESLVNIHRLISSNAASVVPNLGRGRHGHIALSMTMEEYLSQAGHTFLPPHNPGD